MLFPGRATSYDPCQLQSESCVPSNCTSEREKKLKLICRDQFPRTELRPWHKPYKCHILLSLYMFTSGCAPAPEGLSISNKDVPLINNWPVFWTQVFLQFKTALVNPVIFLVSTPNQNVSKCGYYVKPVSIVTFLCKGISKFFPIYYFTLSGI